jgi:hypothetical protein
LRVFLFDHVFGGGGEDTKMKFIETHEAEGKADMRSDRVRDKEEVVPSKDAACEDENSTDGDLRHKFGRPDWFFYCFG